ncbi:MAG: hypothetical protein OEN50_16610, partial [Deltaproteobacteria bacterium]|nr:hypothetical protein [Deltaproteobacteria bacterium]
LSLGEIFDLEGEEYYRAVEEKTLQRILKRPPGIVAVGGGLVMNPTAFLRLKLHAFIVWLQASPETLISRVRRGKDELRLSSHPQVGKQLKTILDRRIAYYSQADFLVNTNGKSPDAVSKAIIHKFRNFGKPRSVR